MAKTILIVEDNQQIRMMVKIILSGQGYEVFEASNGIEGASVFIENEIDLILLDIMMPTADGRKFIAVAEEKLLKEKTPICVLSALGDEKVIGEFLELGAIDYLIKPIDKDILLDKVSEIVNSENLSFAQVITNFNVTFSGINYKFKVISLSENYITIQAESEIKLPQSAVIETGRLLEISKTTQSIIGRFSKTVLLESKYITRFYFIGLKEIFRRNIRAVAVRGGELNETA